VARKTAPRSRPGHDLPQPTDNENHVMATRRKQPSRAGRLPHHLLPPKTPKSQAVDFPPAQQQKRTAQGQGPSLHRTLQAQGHQPAPDPAPHPLWPACEGDRQISGGQHKMRPPKGALRTTTDPAKVSLLLNGIMISPVLSSTLSAVVGHAPVFGVCLGQARFEF
jgi:hypothetical protein